MEIVLAIAFFVFLFFKPRETFKYFKHMSREYEKCMGAPQGVHLFD